MMADSYCLTKDELLEFIKHLKDEQYYIDHDSILYQAIIDWRVWEKELVCLSNSFLEILEQFEKENSITFVKDYISLISALSSDTGYELIIEGYSEGFVEYMFKFFGRDTSLDISEDLSRIRTLFGNHNFGFIAR